MNKDTITIKKLLKVDLFKLCDQALEFIDGEYQNWSTGVIIKPSDYSADRLRELHQLGEDADLDFASYFKGGGIVFLLTPMISPDGRREFFGRFRLEFILASGLDGDCDDNKPSTKEIETFIQFIREKNE